MARLRSVAAHPIEDNDAGWIRPINIGHYRSVSVSTNASKVVAREALTLTN